MKCPHCADVTLLMAERQGIEVDYCPQCRGIWLDRGELDRLIDIAGGSASPTLLSRQSPHAASAGRRRDFDDSGHGGESHDSHRRRRSWLSDIFG